MKLKETENEVSKLMAKTEALQDNERKYLSKVEKLELQLKEAQDTILELSPKEIAPLTPDMTNDKEDVYEGNNTDNSVGDQIDVLYYNSKDDFAVLINTDLSTSQGCL